MKVRCVLPGTHRVFVDGVEVDAVAVDIPEGWADVLSDGRLPVRRVHGDVRLVPR